MRRRSTPVLTYPFTPVEPRPNTAYRARVYFVKDEWRDGYTYEIQRSSDMGVNWVPESRAPFTYSAPLRSARRRASKDLRKIIVVEMRRGSASEELIYA